MTTTNELFEWDALSLLEQIRHKLPGKEVMLYWCTRWSVGSLVQAPSTIEIRERYGQGETPEEAIWDAAKTLGII